MKLLYGHFIGKFKSPTCPDVPGGKEKILRPPYNCAGALWLLTWFDLIWQFFACRACGAHCVHGRKNLFYNHWPGMFPGNCWSIFFFTPHWAETADFWPRVKITADATVDFLPTLNTFLLNVDQKKLLSPYSCASWLLAEGQNHCWHNCTTSPNFKHFSFGCRPKMIMDAHSIRFLRGCLAPKGCNLS